MCAILDPGCLSRRLTWAVVLVRGYAKESGDTLGMMISEDLLQILRCPACVSGPDRRPGEDPGRLELARDCWLVCTEPACGRKYPIVDDIPVMFVKTGDRFARIPVADLPVPPPKDVVD